MERVNEALPRVGVSAIVVRRGEILVVRRSHPPARGQWSFPGGRLEPGERLRACARREVREETGLDVEVGPLVDVVEILADEEGAAYHYVVLDYLARRVGGTLTPGDDASEARWVRPQALADLCATPRVASLALKALEQAAELGW